MQTLSKTKIKTFFILLLPIILIAQSGKEVKNYPQGFSSHALKNIRSEMADSGQGMQVVSSIAQLKANNSTKPVYLAGSNSGVFVYKSSGYTQDSVTVFAADGGGYKVREDYLNNPKIRRSNWIMTTSGDQSNNLQKLINSANKDNANIVFSHLYSINSKIEADTTISLSGIDTTCGIQGDNSYNRISDDGAGLWIFAQNVTIKNFRFFKAVCVVDSNFSGLTLEHLVFDSCASNNSYANCITTPPNSGHTKTGHNIIIRDILIKNGTNNMGGIKFYDTSVKNVFVDHVIIDNMTGSSGQCDFISIGRNDYQDSSVIVQNCIFSHLYTWGRTRPIEVYATPFTIISNQFRDSRITSDMVNTRGFEGIRTATNEGIISANSFLNIFESDSDAVLISVKSTPTAAESYNKCIISNNISRNVDVNRGILASGAVSIVNNDMQLNTGSSLILYNNSTNTIDSTKVSENKFISDVYCQLFRGNYSFENNEWAANPSVYSAIFSHGAHQDTSSVPTNTYINGDKYLCDSTQLWGAYDLQDSGSFVMKNSEIRLRNDTGNPSFSTITDYRLTDFRLINTDIYIESTIDYSNSLFNMPGGFVFNDVRIHQSGSLAFGLFYLNSNVKKTIEINEGYFDFTDATTTGNKFIFVWNGAAYGDSTVIRKLDIYPKSNIDYIFQMNGINESIESFGILDVRHCDISGSKLINISDSEDSLLTFNLFNNVLDYTTFLSGSGSITTVNHHGNTQVSLPNSGSRLYSSGIATLSGTSKVITHGLINQIPDSTTITIVPWGSIGPSSIWPGIFTATQFTLSYDSTLTTKVLWRLGE